MGRYEFDVIRKEEDIFESTKQIYKNTILEKFRAGIKIKRMYKDIAWEIFKEEGIDPMSDWKPAEAAQK